MKWLAIANPAAGRAHEVERMIGRLRATRGLDVEIVVTRAPHEATRLAATAQGVDGIVAVGGDGTIAEVLQGIDLRRHVLALLPAGHGNCLARDLGLGEADRAFNALRRADCIPLDLLRAHIDFAHGAHSERWCASTLSVGYVTDVVEFGRRHLAALGRGAYAAAALLVRPRPFDAELRDSTEPAAAWRYTGVVINNTAHLANFRGFPDASVRDGLLDVMEQRHCWPRQLLHNAAVLAGSRRFGPARLHQACEARLHLGQPRTLMADGELLRSVTDIDVECRPAALRCVAAT